MVHRSHGRGTLVIDRHFQKVLGGRGRLNLASGTNDPKLYQQIAYTMLDQFAERQPQLLEELRDHYLTPLQAYRLWLSGEWLRYTGNAHHARPLRDTMARWIKRTRALVRRRQLAAKSLEARLAWEQQVLAVAKAGATLRDLPGLVERVREACDDDDTASKFNHFRSHTRAFLRDEVKMSDRLYLAVKDIRPLRESPKLGRNPQTPEGARAIAERLSPAAAAIWLDLCHTGMNLKEYFADGWEIAYELGAVRIHGRKRQARERLVPLLRAPSVPTLTREGFKSALTRAQLGVSAHDARRSFRVWLSRAGVDPAAANYFAGHSAGSMAELYTQPGENLELIRSWIVDATPKLLATLGLAAPGLRVASA